MKNLIFYGAFLVSGLLWTGCMVPLKNAPINPRLSLETPHIDFGRLYEFAELSAAVYEPTPAIQKAYPDTQLMIRNLPQSDGRYMIIINHKRRTQTLSVRGTANKQNAKVDINSIKVWDPTLEIYVHQGFKEATEELINDARPFLQKDYLTRITGHSLGGAMAVLTMLHLMSEGYAVDQVLTFGQPKVTNEEGVLKFIDAPLFRIINDGDIVAQVPPSNLVFDLSGPYQHLGPEVILRPEGRWSYAPAHVAKDFLTEEKWKDLNIHHGTDHQMKNYLMRIKALK